MLEKLDNTISILTESAARAISRRCVLASAVKGVVAAAAGLTLGVFTEVKNAFAIDWTTCNPQCDCHWANGEVDCPKVCGLGNCCPNTGCPSGCSICTSSSGCSNNVCNYSDGAWCACNNLGICHAGYKLCLDCKCSCSNDCTNQCNGSWYYVCTCRSVCICCNCCTPKDVEAEMRRLAALGLQAA